MTAIQQIEEGFFFVWETFLNNKEEFEAVKKEIVNGNRYVAVVAARVTFGLLAKNGPTVCAELVDCIQTMREFLDQYQEFHQRLETGEVVIEGDKIAFFTKEAWDETFQDLFELTIWLAQ